MAGIEFPEASKLKGWPEVGETYLVPFAQLPNGKLLPTYGKMHRCFDHDPLPHYHIDPRFLTEADEDYLAQEWAESAYALRNEPISQSQHPDALKGALSGTISFNKDSVRRLLPRRCRYGRVEWDVLPRDANWHQGHFPHMRDKRYVPGTAVDSTVSAIIKDGRPRCPHQGFDLTCVWDGKSSYVRCPLHGLKVDMSKCVRG